MHRAAVKIIQSSLQKLKDRLCFAFVHHLVRAFFSSGEVFFLHSACFPEIQRKAMFSLASARIKKKEKELCICIFTVH